LAKNPEQFGVVLRLIWLSLLVGAILSRFVQYISQTTLKQLWKLVLKGGQAFCQVIL
jgi:hypothetical protein